jgi:hypothetical protein
LPEWLVERGIGESRFALIEDSAIVDARILIDGLARAGTERQTVLKSIGPPAVAADGDEEFILPGGASGVAEGARITIEVTRERIPGVEPWKRPLARLADANPITPVEGRTIPFPAPHSPFDAAGWNDLIDEARSGIVRFAGGELRISPTPAMTLIDVDGHLPPAELAVRGAAEAARAIRRLDIGGSIGIDLPTVGGKAVRQAAAGAIDAVLPPPFERTAVNGFGFVQVVRPRRRASLVELAQDRAAFEARALLRRIAFERAGAKRLVAHPAVIAVIEPRSDWIEALSRQVGGAIELRGEPALPMSGGYAEKL